MRHHGKKNMEACFDTGKCVAISPRHKKQDIERMAAQRVVETSRQTSSFGATQRLYLKLTLEAVTHPPRGRLNLAGVETTRRWWERDEEGTVCRLDMNCLSRLSGRDSQKEEEEENTWASMCHSGLPATLLAQILLIRVLSLSLSFNLFFIYSHGISDCDLNSIWYLGEKKKAKKKKVL